FSPFAPYLPPPRAPAAGTFPHLVGAKASPLCPPERSEGGRDPPSGGKGAARRAGRTRLSRLAPYGGASTHHPPLTTRYPCLRRPYPVWWARRAIPVAWERPRPGSLNRCTRS